MRDILKYLWRYRFRISLGLLSLFIVDGSQLIVPLIIRRAIDELAANKYSNLASYGLYILGLAVIVLIFRFFWRYFLVGAARRIRRELRNRLYEHLLSLGAKFFNRTRTGDIMAHATNDVDAVMMACGFGVLALADAIIMVSFSLMAMLSISLKLTLYAFIPLPFVTLIVFGFGRIIHKRFQVVQEVFATLTEKVRESLSGIRIIKSFVQEEGMSNDFKKTNELFVNKNMYLVRIWGLFDPAIALLAGFSTAIVLWAGGKAVISGAISLGDFVAFTTYLGMLTWPMMALGWVVNLMQRGAASMERINKILAVKPEIVDIPNPKIFPTRARIGFRDLSFSYNGGPPVLRGLSLKIEEGMTLGVVGIMGSGKSTLAHLILRVFDPPPRSLFIDGLDVREISLKDLRKNIGLVPQDPFLFSATIRENIAFGKPQATEEEIIKAAKLAGIYEEIMEMPEGFSTRVGERGVSLSGGQKQRVGIARALILDPKILILDDALSSVDAEKEELILHNLKGVLKARTSIVIAHRISAVKDADHIIVLDKGRIIEEGIHEDLIAKDGLYARLWELQKTEEGKELLAS